MFDTKNAIVDFACHSRGGILTEDFHQNVVAEQCKVQDHHPEWSNVSQDPILTQRRLTGVDINI